MEDPLESIKRRWDNRIFPLHQYHNREPVWTYFTQLVINCVRTRSQTLCGPSSDIVDQT